MTALYAICGGRQGAADERAGNGSGGDVMATPEQMSKEFERAKNLVDEAQQLIESLEDERIYCRAVQNYGRSGRIAKIKIRAINRQRRRSDTYMTLAFSLLAQEAH